MSLVCFVTQVRSTLRSSAPRARKGYPQASALRLCSPPLRSALSTHASLRFKGGRSPSPCSCYPPPSPGGVRHVCHMPLPIQRQRQRQQPKEEAPVNTTATTAVVSPFAQNNNNKQQKQTAKEVIAANVQALIEQLEQGHSEALTAYLTAMGRFHNYSFGNILEIARQKPDATRVAGLYAWNQLGRKVKKGEHGIRILAPVIGVRRKKDEEAEKDIRTQNQAVLVGFRAAHVFDVSQTEGTELPEFSERVSGNAGQYRDRLVDFVIAQGIALEFKESIAPALGVSYGGKIALLPGQSSAEEFSTLVHELAHEMLHKAERRTATTKTVRETEAEAVAFVVGKTIGLETGRASADYIHLYHGNASLLAESLEVIQKTSAVILSALETLELEINTEAEPDLAQASYPPLSPGGRPHAVRSNTTPMPKPLQESRHEHRY